MNYSQHELRELEKLARRQPTRRLTTIVASIVNLALLGVVLFGVAALFHKGTP